MFRLANLANPVLHTAPSVEFSPLRLLLIAAHPDDETMGAGILMTWLKNVHVVHVTDGSPLNLSDARAAGFSRRDRYAAARCRETTRVLAKIGIRKSKIKRLHFIDQHVLFLPDRVDTAGGGLTPIGLIYCSLMLTKAAIPITIRSPSPATQRTEFVARNTTILARSFWNSPVI